MKSTSHNTKCSLGSCAIARSGKAGAMLRAHTPARHRTAPARVEALPALQGLDHPAYEELLAPVRVNSSGGARPRVLHVDTETGTAAVLAGLLGSDADVTHVVTLSEARQLLQREIFSLVILDPALPDGDAKALLPLLEGTPLLVYSDKQPEWRDVAAPAYLSKSWTNARQLWSQMSSMLKNTSAVSAGD